MNRPYVPFVHGVVGADHDPPAPPRAPVVILSEGAYHKMEERVRNTSDRVEGSLSGAGRGELLSRA